MYLRYYNLNREPFHITPDPDFLYLSSSHKEALASIIYGVEQRKGFICITGEVGTGKTTVVRSYLDKIDRNQIRPIYLFNSNLSYSALLDYICNELTIKTKYRNINSKIESLHRFLVAEYQSSRNIVLIIDEAQNMPIDTLENLRMLSNLETNQEKLIQIILIGQPELDKKLSLHELRQLKQRIALRADIVPLSLKESELYILHRLSLTSLSNEKLFTRRAIKKICKHARGVPRVINILCDNALIAGFGFQNKSVDIDIVKAVIRDYEGKYRNNRISVSPIIFAGLLILLFFTVFSMPEPQSIQLKNIQNIIGHYFKSQSVKADPLYSALSNVKTGSKVQNKTEHTPVKPPSNNTPVYADSTLPPAPGVIPFKASFNEDFENQKTGLLMEDREAKLLLPDKPLASSNEIEESFTNETTDRTINKSELTSEVSWIKPEFPVVKVVKEGDCLTRLCAQTYGIGNDKTLLKWIKKNNLQIKNINRLRVGDVLIFPEPDDSIRQIIQYGELNSM